MDLGKHGNFRKNGVQEKGYDYSVLLNLLEAFLVFVFAYGSFKTKAIAFILCVITKRFVSEFSM